MTTNQDPVGPKEEDTVLGRRTAHSLSACRGSPRTEDRDLLQSMRGKSVGKAEEG